MIRARQVPERTGGRPGHTLMEMLVALAILGVMAGAVAPTLHRTGDESGVTRTSRALVELLQRSRASAAERGVVVTLVIDPSTGRAWIGMGEEGSLVEDAVAESLAESLVRARRAGNPVAMAATGPRARWTFAPSGLAFGDAVVVHDATHALIVGADGWTGESYAHPR